MIRIKNERLDDWEITNRKTNAYYKVINNIKDILNTRVSYFSRDDFENYINLLQELLKGFYDETSDNINLHSDELICEDDDYRIVIVLKNPFYKKLENAPACIRLGITSKFRGVNMETMPMFLKLHRKCRYSDGTFFAKAYDYLDLDNKDDENTLSLFCVLYEIYRIENEGGILELDELIQLYDIFISDSKELLSETLREEIIKNFILYNEYIN